MRRREKREEGSRNFIVVNKHVGRRIRRRDRLRNARYFCTKMQKAARERHLLLTAHDNSLRIFAKLFAEITRLDLVEGILLSASHRSLKTETDLVSFDSNRCKHSYLTSMELNKELSFAG